MAFIENILFSGMNHVMCVLCLLYKLFYTDLTFSVMAVDVRGMDAFFSK